MAAPLVRASGVVRVNLMKGQIATVEVRRGDEQDCSVLPSSCHHTRKLPPKDLVRYLATSLRSTCIGAEEYDPVPRLRISHIRTARGAAADSILAA